jgi:outer membrane lipoprotein-sorting protein
MRNLLLQSIAAVLVFGLTASADSFDRIKKELASPGCRKIEFLNTVKSDVFDVVDSTYGTAVLSPDGRYNVSIGPNQYICDLQHVYSYSQDNNQVVIESTDSATYSDDEISFVLRLDDLYKTYVLKPNQSYRLVKKGDAAGDFPDSMTVTIDSDKLLLKQIEYYDVNDELNTITLIKQDYHAVCKKELFEPDFPDSVERVRL